MALNYNNQFNYTGKGFADSKMNPFATKDDLLKLSSADLLASYVPGMSVWVLEDGATLDIAFDANTITEQNAGINSTDELKI